MIFWEAPRPQKRALREGTETGVVSKVLSSPKHPFSLQLFFPLLLILAGFVSCSENTQWVGGVAGACTELQRGVFALLLREDGREGTVTGFFF